MTKRKLSESSIRADHELNARPHDSVERRFKATIDTCNVFKVPPGAKSAAGVSRSPASAIVSCSAPLEGS